MPKCESREDKTAMRTGRLPLADDISTWVKVAMLKREC
jgi:hypothetical protein